MLVSVLIPCFNAEAWIGQAIESALAQTWPDTEVIVVDDGSADGSLDVIRAFGDRIRWEHGPNRGGGATRNRLLDLARGEWIQYLDADDLLLPDKLARQIAFLGARADVDLVCNPTLIERLIDGERVLTEPPSSVSNDPWVLLALWLLPQTGGPLWRRSTLLQVGGWRVGQPCCQEHELYERLLEAGARFAFDAEPLAIYRVWDLGPRLVSRMIDEIPRQRLMILERMESFLQQNGSLTRERRQAINDARHQLARDRWTSDPRGARQIVHRIARSDARYRPSAGPTSPAGYRLAYSLLGFHGAQRLAAARRRLAGMTAIAGA